jgi:hypothetical protein
MRRQCLTFVTSALRIRHSRESGNPEFSAAAVVLDSRLRGNDEEKKHHSPSLIDLARIQAALDWFYHFDNIGNMERN